MKIQAKMMKYSVQAMRKATRISGEGRKRRWQKRKFKASLAVKPNKLKWMKKLDNIVDKVAKLQQSTEGLAKYFLKVTMTENFNSGPEQVTKNICVTSLPGQKSMMNLRELSCTCMFLPTSLENTSERPHSIPPEIENVENLGDSPHSRMVLSSEAENEENQRNTGTHEVPELGDSLADASDASSGQKQPSLDLVEYLRSQQSYAERMTIPLELNYDSGQPAVSESDTGVLPYADFEHLFLEYQETQRLTGLQDNTSSPNVSSVGTYSLPGGSYEAHIGSPGLNVTEITGLQSLPPAEAVAQWPRVHEFGEMEELSEPQVANVEAAANLPLQEEDSEQHNFQEINAEAAAHLMPSVQEQDDRRSDIELTNPDLGIPLPTDIDVHRRVYARDIDLRWNRRNRNLLRNLLKCHTCFGRNKATLNFPCMCFCNCLVCAPMMRYCAKCQMPIDGFIEYNFP